MYFIPTHQIAFLSVVEALRYWAIEYERKDYYNKIIFGLIQKSLKK